MYLHVQGTSAQLRLSDARLSASRGFGFVVLRLSSDMTVPVPGEDDDIYSVQLHGLAYLTTNRRSRPVAAISPPAVRTLAPREGRLSGHLQVSMLTSLETLDAVEVQRDGAGIELRLDFEGMLRGPSGKQWSLRGQPTLRQEAMEWEHLLEQAGYHEVVRFAIPAPRKEGSASWNTAVDRLRQAQDALLRGDPRAAIGKVRPIIELLWPESSKRSESRGERRERTLEQRFSGIVAELREVTHPSHHEDEITKTMEWTRRDAIAAIAIAAALMQREGRRTPFQ